MRNDIEAELAEALRPHDAFDEAAAMDRIRASIDAHLARGRSAAHARRRAPHRTLLIAFAALLTVGVVTAVAGPAIRAALWDEAATHTGREITDPGGAVLSELAAASFARTTTSPTDVAQVEDILRRSPPEYSVLLDPALPVRTVSAPGIKRTLTYKEVAGGGFCFQLSGGEIGHGGCVADFNSAGVTSSSGFVGSSAIMEGFVARDVTKLVVELRSGDVEPVVVEHGLFTWSQPVDVPRNQRVVGIIATRDGRRIRAAMFEDSGWSTFEQLRSDHARRRGALR